MISMSPNKKTIVFSIIFGIATLALIFVVINPLFKGIKKSSEEFITARKELVLSKEQAEKFEEFKEVYKELKPNLEKIDKLFINPEIPIDLIKFWEKQAKDSELSIKISPVFIDMPENDPWKSMGFRLTLIGSFPDFLKFLEKTETSPYLIEIQNLNAEKTIQGVSVTLITKVYTK